MYRIPNPWGFLDNRWVTCRSFVRSKYSPSNIDFPALQQRGWNASSRRRWIYGLCCCDFVPQAGWSGKFRQWSVAPSADIDQSQWGSYPITGKSSWFLSSAALLKSVLAICIGWNNDHLPSWCWQNENFCYVTCQTANWLFKNDKMVLHKWYIQLLLKNY